MATFLGETDESVFRELYDIREVNSLAEFLLPEHSLCIIHNPEWREFRERERIDGRVRLITVRGHNRQGLPDKVLLGICSPEDQGYYRQKLDQNLKSSFLFATWKHETHGFRLIRDRQAITFFPTFDNALGAYFPDGFIPGCYLEEKSLDNEHIFDPDGLEIGDGGIE